MKQNTNLKEEIKELTTQIEQLQGLLESHACVLSTEKLEAVEHHVNKIAKDGIEQEAESQTSPQNDGKLDDGMIISTNSGDSSGLLRYDIQ